MSQNEPRSYDVEIGAPPERVWRAITDPDLTQRYYFGTRVESDWAKDSPIRYRNAQGGIDLDGEILEIEPGRRLTTTFRPTWSPEVEGSAPSTVSWEIEPAGDGVRLRLTHSGFDWSTPGAEMIDGGWRQTVAGLKDTVESHPG